MGFKSLLLALALLVTAAGAALTGPTVLADTLINGQLSEATGATSMLGGGDHVFVRFGSDAAFGVVYGTTANPNNIYIVAIKARYLGLAQVVDTQDRAVGQNRPVKVYTLYAIQLDSILEFRDRNLNGLADYGRLYNDTTGQFSDYYARAGGTTDTLYKKVDLHTNWTASPIVRSNDTQNRSWSFNLTAGNLSYLPIANYTGITPGALPTVRFAFHLNASLAQTTNATVPQWRVVVDTARGQAVTDLTRLENLTVSGKAVHYDLKWDQEISGWSYESVNTAGIRRRLFLELGAIVGNVIPAGIVDAWFQTRVMAQIGEAGVARFTTAAGSETANESTGIGTAVRRLQSPFVDFEGDWTRIGRFVWVSGSLVDGNAVPVFGQVVRGARFVAIGESGTAFVGFAVLFGLSFFGGTTVIHDPTVTTDVQADLDLPGSTLPGALFAIAVVTGAVVIGALLLAVLFVMRRRKRTDLPPPPDD